MKNILNDFGMTLVKRCIFGCYRNINMPKFVKAYLANNQVKLQTISIYALKHKKQFEFICVAKTKKEFEQKIQKAYINQYSMRPEGTTLTIEKYLKNYIKAKVIIEKID